MRRALVLIVVAACGRVGFDAHAGDGSAASGTPIGVELPAGGELHRITIADDGTWYAVDAIGDAYRSDDGSSWVHCGDVAATDVITDSDGLVYASGADVMVSADRCATWQPTGIDRFTQALGRYKSEIFALADIGLRERTGSTWTPVPTPLDGARFNALGACSACPWVVGTNSGLMTSSDGLSWTVVPAGQLPTQNVEDVASSPTRTYAITAVSGDAPGGVACSDGVATTWTTCFDSGGIAVAVDPTDDQHAFASVYDLLVETHDAFATPEYDRRGGAMGAAIVRQLAFLPDGGVAAATDRGAYYAAPGTIDWQPRHTGLDAWTVNDLVRTGDELYLATDGGVIHGVVGQPYTASLDGLDNNTQVNAIAIAPDGTPLAVGRHVWTSADHGATWLLQMQLGPGDGYRGFAIAFDGARAYIGTYAQVYSADPPYQTWTAHPLPGGDHWVTGLVVTGGALWASTTSGVFVSTDQAATFQAAGALGTSSYLSLARLADGRLVAGSEGDGVWISDAAHATWQGVGPPGAIVRKVAEAAGAIVASTDAGVDVTHDGGVTWTLIASTAALHPRTVLLDPADGQLVVSSLGRGLVRTPLP